MHESLIEKAREAIVAPAVTAGSLRVTEEIAGMLAALKEDEANLLHDQ
jgi:hypothetical protein